MSSNCTCKEQETARVPILGLVEAACPHPNYAKGTSYVVDVLNRSCCIPQRNLPTPQVKLRGMLNSLLGMDDLEYELDDNNRHIGLLSCSPPVRASNPLVYDVKFVHKNVEKDSATPFGGINHYSGLKASCNGAYLGKSTIRVEGFASGSSKSQ